MSNSEKPSCSTCMYFKGGSLPKLGDCRLNPPLIIPTVLGSATDTAALMKASLFPVVWSNDWCGQHMDPEDLPEPTGDRENVIEMRPAA